MNLNKTLGVFLVGLLLVSMILVVIVIPRDAVSGDPAPAQAIWVEPKVTGCLTVGETFVVDVLVNVTAPTSPSGTGMM
ncbi:MAG: hypothetical protein NWE78_01735, partial [Candidatus Bathyarchaeota archaeon]|nr:hypothetical protein [Candidatus Bathyarchaeota archaeon]